LSALKEIVRLLTEASKINLAISIQNKNILGEMRSHSRSVEAAAQDIKASEKLIQDTLHLLGLVQQKQVELEAEEKQRHQETKYDRLY
jgi:hypothetical protein